MSFCWQSADVPWVGYCGGGGGGRGAGGVIDLSSSDA
jgi:hypothetical protein